MVHPLAPLDNRLLEKAELLTRISEKLQPEPNDATPATHQGPWEEESEPDSDQVPSPTTLRMKWQEEEEGLRLVCGEQSLSQQPPLGEGLGARWEPCRGAHAHPTAGPDHPQMAYQVVVKSAALGALESTLEERQSRLAALEARVAQLQEARAQQTRHLDAQRALNVAQRAAYEALRAQAGLQEAALRRHEEEARDLLEWLVQRKARAAAERNLRNERHERAKQARMSLELKKAAKRTVSISESPNTVGDGIREMAETVTLTAEPLSLETEAGEKWKRPFSVCLRHLLDALPLCGCGEGASGEYEAPVSEGLAKCLSDTCPPPSFKKRRGHSVGGAPEQRYQSIPVYVAVQPPTQVQDVLNAHLSEVNAVCFGPNSSLLATGGADRLIHLWNVVGGRLEANQTLEGAGGSITSVDFDPSGSQILAATYNQAAQLWKVGDAQSKVTAAKFKLTRHQAVTGSRDRTVKEWDLGRAYCSRTINVLSYCNDVVCGDHVIISGHNDQKIRFWDSRGPCCTQVIPVQGRVTSLNLSHDQLHLLSCSRDNTLKVIDLRVSNIRQVFRADGFKCGSDWTKAVFSPDRSYALAGSWDGALYVWDVDTGKLEGSLRGPHCTAVNAVAWCYSGSHVVSVDQARKVVLWH
ncbi:protein Atg16l2 isoform X1 [Prionailurus iriomotensis]